MSEATMEFQTITQFLWTKILTFHKWIRWALVHCGNEDRRITQNRKIAWKKWGFFLVFSSEDTSQAFILEMVWDGVKAFWKGSYLLNAKV